MKRKLLKQMLNEWRANIWLVVELIIVVLIVQVIFSTLYNIYTKYKSGAGVDCNDVYVAALHTLSEGKEGYVPYDSIHSRTTDIEVLLAQLRSNPYVETVATANYSSMPYNYNYIGNMLSFKDEAGKEFVFGGNTRSMSPEMMKVFRISGENGETSEQLGAMLEKGSALIARPERKYHDDESSDASDFLGKDVIYGCDSLRIYNVGAITTGMRRSDYESLWAGVIYLKLYPDEITNLVFRTKPGMGRLFLESLQESDMQAGNVYLTDFRSIDDMRRSCQIRTSNFIRNYIICALFMLLVIFLGFLGTFWFRTQQRVSEIAIRKVNGASNRDIYVRFFAEGLIMLGAAVLLTLPLTIWIMVGPSSAILEALPMDIYIKIPAAVLAVVVLAVLIVAGIYAPARKATVIDPALALKDM